MELWQKLTSLPLNKQGPALIGRLTGEAKSLAKTLDINEIVSQEGVTRILYQLDKSYGTNRTYQLDMNLSDFLAFTWASNMNVELLSPASIQG